MAVSAAEETEINAGTLKVELQKVLTEIFYDGKGCNDIDDDTQTETFFFEFTTETESCVGVLKAIDEAIRILTCLRKLESKKSESDNSPSPSVSVEVPKEFICPLSNKIMIEPVIIASGQTYEKKHIIEWLKLHCTCPKTNEVLSHCFWIPNHLINEMITQWCQVNKFDRPKPHGEIIMELCTGDIESLLNRISSPSSVEDQTQASKKLRRLTKMFANVRAFFITEIHDSITRLLSPLSTLGEALDSNPELQEEILTALYNLSIPEDNKIVIAQNPLVIPLLTKSLKKGTTETRRNAAATLSSLSVIDSNKVIIGNSETVNKALISLIQEGDLLATRDAASAVFNLCKIEKNKEEAVLAGLIPAVINKIKAKSNVDELLFLLALVSTQNRAIDEMDNIGFINDLFSVLRKPSCTLTEENAVVIVFSICDRNRNMSKMEMLIEEENQHGTFTKLVKQGSGRAVRKAEGILQLIRRRSYW